MGIKGIFITVVNINNNKMATTGIGKKILRQIDTFRENGLEVKLMVVPLLYKCKIINSIIARLPFCPIGNRWNLNFNAKDFDFIYIRKGAIDLSFYLYIKKIKKQNNKIKILLEIPTYPYEKETYGFCIKPILVKDRLWGSRLHRYIDRIITFSDDEIIFGIKTIQTSNGIDTHDFMPRKQNNSNTINMIAVAQLMPWHGYDRIIEGLHKYYDGNNARNVIFHLVGNGPEYEKLREMIISKRLQEHVIIYGTKTGSDLQKIYEFADIGIDSLGRHRFSVKYNSTLKGKEYLSVGLPIISGVKTELDFDQSFNYYLRVDATDDPIDIQKIIDFYDNIFHKKNNEDINCIRKQINKYCNDHFTHDIVWKNVVEYIKN